MSEFTAKRRVVVAGLLALLLAMSPVVALAFDEGPHFITFPYLGTYGRSTLADHDHDKFSCPYGTAHFDINYTITGRRDSAHPGKVRIDYITVRIYGHTRAMDYYGLWLTGSNGATISFSVPWTTVWAGQTVTRNYNPVDTWWPTDGQTQLILRARHGEGDTCWMDDYTFIDN